jgi:predicted nuclease with RNAse H fold
MKTAGIDLAAQPKNTAVCVVLWAEGAGRVIELREAQDDEALVGLIGEKGVSRIGIDAPLGWPDAFVDAVAGHRESAEWPDPDEGQTELRRRLCFRATDLHLNDLGFRPLSVAADKIAVPTMRCAHLLSRWAAEGKPVDRSGKGMVAEVYPAAALKRWGLASAGYKRAPNRDNLKQLVASLLQRATWLKLDPASRASFEHDDNAFDALVCALVARAVARRQTEPPEGGGQLDQARREGWIHVPHPDSLTRLAS